ncbi:hypothetical protein [Caballeronia telluris]|jgi:hypothetical protein|uniref:Uncharacterized protein n=1 Tax=Caballeronia telluris TaxID=326475 RepID=A0A158JHT6_9BURK|nr:hypothetical protein [Caballeronia telluris]SAL68019.1 hypothetical protein AWB66_04219 [Caballeronia telluris]
MNQGALFPFGVDEALFDDARLVAARVSAMRRAQGQAVPSDFAEGTPEADAIALDFLRDIERALDHTSKSLTGGH